MHRYRILVLCILISAPVTELFAQQSCDYRFRDGSDIMQQKTDTLELRNQPGFVTLVGKGDSVLFQHAGGVRDMQSGEPLDMDTPFYVASIGKTFTAMAVLLLFDEGQLRLEQPVRDFFPDMPRFLESVTVHHLLNHTSGLPDYYDEFGENVELDNEKVMTYVRGLDSLQFRPGYDFAYSNTGYVLLAEIIEKLSGISYAAFIRTRFLEPLEMRNTVVVDRPGRKPVNAAVGYVEEKERWVTSDYEGIYTTGPGGIYSTAGDLFKWYQAIRDRRFLKGWTGGLMFTAPYLVTGRKSYLAMGWFDESFGSRPADLSGLRAWGAIGVLKGYRVNLHFFPDQDVVFIQLSNSGKFHVYVSEVARAYLSRVREGGGPK